MTPAAAPTRARAQQTKTVIATNPGRPCAVVIGLDSITGLQTARLLRARGIAVTGLAADARHPCARTNVCDVITTATDSEALVDTLLALSPRLGAGAVLFPCTDLSVRVLARHREPLDAAYRIGLGGLDSIDRLMDKARFAEFAAEHDLPVPDTVVVRDAADARRVADELTFPAIVKPSVRDGRWDAQAPSKVLPVTNADQWRATYPLARTWADTLVVQRWVPGPESALYSCNCYFSADAQPLVTFVARKLRQWPPDHGVSCLGEEVRDDEVLRTAVRLFRAAGFQGLGYVECKRDASTGQLLIIEANVGRPTGRSAIAEAGGVELLQTAYCDLAGLALPAQLEQQYLGARWVYMRRDAQAAFRQWRRRELTLAEWARSWRGLRHDAMFSVRDQRPFWTDVARAASRVPLRHLVRAAR